MYRSLREAERGCGVGEKIWAGVYSSGACYFLVASPLEFWRDRMLGDNLTYCEIIRPSGCHFFIDIDGGEPDAIWGRLKKDLEMVYGGLGNPLRHVVLRSDGGGKKSMHIISKGDRFCLESPRVGLDFFRLLRAGGEEFRLNTLDEDWAYIDTKIYTKNRQFRMLGCSKPGQNRPFVGVPFTYESWLDTLVQPLESRDFVNIPRSVSRDTSWSSGAPDLVRDLVKHLDVGRIYHPEFSWVWIVQHRGCRFAGRVHRKNNNYVVVSLEHCTLTYRCHHCTERRFTERFSEDVCVRVRDMLYGDIRFSIS